MPSETIRSPYAPQPGRLDRARRTSGPPLTLAEKSPVAHSVDLDHRARERGSSILRFEIEKPDGRLGRIEALHTTKPGKDNR